MPEKPHADFMALLEALAHHLLMTDEGPLDVLGSIADDRDFARLLDHSQVIRLTSGLVVRVLDLPTLIEVKQRTGGEQDRMMVAILKRIHAERGAGG